jgi:thiosulfate/3-mercaptopyruvate sulfurtransferase
MKLDYDAMRHLPDHVLLLDARRRTRYLGEFEPMDPKAGHIPRARSAPWGGNLDADGRFRSPMSYAAGSRSWVSSMDRMSSPIAGVASARA